MGVDGIVQVDLPIKDSNGDWVGIGDFVGGMIVPRDELMGKLWWFIGILKQQKNVDIVKPWGYNESTYKERWQVWLLKQ